MTTDLFRILRPVAFSMAAIFVVAASPVSAQQQPAVAAKPTAEAANIETIRLTITPTAVSEPVLKYRLLPLFVDRRPGNAATLYAQAALHYKPTAEAEQRIIALLKAPAAEFDKFAATPEAQQLLPQATLDLLRIASRRERCDWELPVREQMVFSILLPEQQELRKLARLTALAARTQAAQRNYAGAIELLSVGYAMARHQGDTPTLISGLVALTMVRTIDDVVLDLAGRRDAPNLYWALSARPVPLVEFRPGLEAEAGALEMSLPILRDAVEQDPTARNWDVALNEAFDLLELTRNMSGEGDPRSDMQRIAERVGRGALATGTVALRGKAMREYLIERGVPKSRVERMGDAQLVLAHDKLRYDELRDRMFAWAALPYREGLAGLVAAERSLAAGKRESTATLPWAELLLPAVASVRASHVRQERSGDVLRIVEALRDHAAAHGGALPGGLETLQATMPIPMDAVTGRPFEYKMVGDTATLTLPPERASRPTTIYEIKIAK